jgi:hypothetical protein
MGKMAAALRLWSVDLRSRHLHTGFRPASILVGDFACGHLRDLWRIGYRRLDRNSTEYV